MHSSLQLWSWLALSCADDSALAAYATAQDVFALERNREELRENLRVEVYDSARIWSYLGGS